VSAEKGKTNYKEFGRSPERLKERVQKNMKLDHDPMTFLDIKFLMILVINCSHASPFPSQILTRDSNVLATETLSLPRSDIPVREFTLYLEFFF
jgi:hypothetical protein